MIVGISLDGRYDLAATDWDDEGGDAVRIIHGGTQADVITTIDRRRMAGPQAALAPHGRGQGWGDIGKADKRRPLALAVDAPGHGEHAADLAAAIDALARGAQEVVVAVPDVAAFDEAAQGAMINACRANGARRVRLLWRPVAAMLAMIYDGKLGASDVGRQFRLLIQGAHGIEDQVLTLRQDTEHPGHLAPQRNGPGRIWAPELGLDEVFWRAAQRVHASAALDWERCEPSRLGPLLAVGAAVPGQIEVLRHQNGGWRVTEAPELAADVAVPTQVEMPSSSGEITLTVLITPMAEHLAVALAATLGESVEISGSQLIARGCLCAGRLIERGLPHYFDRLEAISIAAMHAGEPAFVPLIPEGHLVAANREYVSEDFTDFVWPRGKAETEFYILKGRSEVRHWAVQKQSAPGRDMPVALRIRQTPGQSWALLDITARDWEVLARAPERLDWGGLNPIDLTPEDVLETLRTPPPTIPERMVEPAHLDLWIGSDWAGDNRASRLALMAAQDGTVDAAAWAELLSRQNRHPQTGVRYRRVTTDGRLPAGLPTAVQLGFGDAMDKLADRLLTGQILRDNDTLRAVTWAFASCPDPVQEAILEALTAQALGNPHRLLYPGHAIRVVRQGAGRAVTGEARLHRLFTLLAEGPVNNDTINALAMAVTRRAEAPRALMRAQVDLFLRNLAAELLEQVHNQSFKVRFKNTLSAIAGLFRWREIEPYALLASDEEPAARLEQTLLEARQLLTRPQWSQPTFPKWHAV